MNCVDKRQAISKGIAGRRREIALPTVIAQGFTVGSSGLKGYWFNGIQSNDNIHEEAA